MLRSGRARLGEWQGLIKVKMDVVKHIRNIGIIVQLLQFTVFSAMLKESLGELHEAANVDIVRKVWPTVSAPPRMNVTHVVRWGS